MSWTRANKLRVEAQQSRLDELADLRLQRPLTDAEQAEEATLERRLAARVWRQQQRAETRRIDAQIAAAANQSKTGEFAHA